MQPPNAAHYGAFHHDYPASDIFAPAGTHVVSPVDGVVEYISRTDRWDPKTDEGDTRGGLSVSIVGDDGVRYYGSHLRLIAAGVTVGVRLAAGSPIGAVGNTGNARGIAPHLHFGISHPTTPTDSRVRRGEVSPYAYLKAWERGRPLTPKVAEATTPSCEPTRG